MTSRRSGLRSAIGLSLTSALLVGGLMALPSAQADTAPVSASLPPTVSTDPLPTWQVTGVVWSQAVVGTTVYATGSFTKARPPGMWQGGPTEISVSHLIAYDIRTGNRISSFNHSLNAQGLVVTASPDGSRIYVGGDFTAVDGLVRQHIAAFDTATGGLVSSFAPVVNGQVKAITATSTTVYVGGSFQSAGGGARKNLASFTASGQLTKWAPSASDGYAYALVLTPDRTKVVVGGQFATLNAAPVYGMGAVDAITGANRPWAANAVIKDSGHGAINSLTSDGTYVYGSGYAFGTGGTFEGAFSLNPSDGSIRWLEDCHGDTYDVEPVGQVAYTVSHSHDCTMVGGFPDTNPRTRWQHAGAWTSYPSGVNNGPDSFGWNYKNQPAPKMLHWYPNLGIGTATGQYQAAWNVAGGAGYVVLGGEFPTVNGKAQQGLTRYATKDTAPNKVGPTYADTVPVRSAAPATSAVAVAPGTVRVSFGAAWDLDNQRLTYQVYRDRGAAGQALIKSFTLDSNFWTLPNQFVTDSGVPAGAHTYQVRISDPFGNQLLSPVSNSVTPASTTISAYAGRVRLDGASHYWRLGESGTTVYDSIATADGTAQSGVGRRAAGAIVGDSDAASTFSGTTAGYVGTGSSAAQGPDTFTVEAWFKTTTTRGGKLVGFGSAKTGSSGSYDRQVYLSNTGRLNFGVYSGAAKVISTPTAYNDGRWHLVTATLGARGQELYVDGGLIARNVTITAGQRYSGYWRIGGDNLTGTWPNLPSSAYVSGTIDEVATYPTQLSATAITAHRSNSGR